MQEEGNILVSVGKQENEAEPAEPVKGLAVAAIVATAAVMWQRGNAVAYRLRRDFFPLVGREEKRREEISPSTSTTRVSDSPAHKEAPGKENLMGRREGKQESNSKGDPIKLTFMQRLPIHHSSNVTLLSRYYWPRMKLRQK